MEYSEDIFDNYKNEPNLNNWIELGFAELMWNLGYEMDCFKSFESYVEHSSLKVKPANTEREEKKNNLYYLEHATRQIVGNYLFSYWRYLTHWSMSGYTEYDVDFLLRIINILENKCKENNPI